MGDGLLLPSRWSMTATLKGDLSGLRALINRTAPVIVRQRPRGVLVVIRTRSDGRRRVTASQHELVKRGWVVVADWDALTAPIVAEAMSGA